MRSSLNAIFLCFVRKESFRLVKECDSMGNSASQIAHSVIARRNRLLHTTPFCWRKKNILNDPLPVPKTREIDARIVVVDADNNDVGVMKKIAAIKLARDRDLKLVNVEEYSVMKESVNRASMHPIYKLLTGEELHKFQLAEREKRKSEKNVHQKVLQLTSSATDHDIMTKIRQGAQWLKKGDEVKVLILGRPDLVARMNEIQKMVLAELKSLYHPSIPDLSKSDRSIKFRLVPVTNSEATKEESSPDEK